MSVAESSPNRAVDRIPATWLVVTSILSVQVGAAIAKHLFGTIPATSMVWLRLVSSAVVLLALARPRLTTRSGRDWVVALLFGVMLLGMNWSIYQSFARIPLGMAVTLEFLGPLTLSVVLSRRSSDLVWVGLAAVGVGLLGFTPHGLTWVGVGFALAAGAFWAGYIVLAERTGRTWPGLTGLAVASLVGAVVLAGPAIGEGGSALLDPAVIGIGLAVGLLSSVIPYSLELMALRRMNRRVFSVLMSLEPAAAALAAMVLLREWLAPLQWLAIACVIGASVGATRAARPAAMPTGAEGPTD
ncbi:EamA family transporter [Aestuariimicrobium sp. T2.26MG-19.2B]|uniref:EamA family transporter n=1 Tax=Aestuariimicrobium sp. T2.26MG-19.2B TaxID=3040679 RepID=UPI00247743D3|nr:EamA family transporter [Aestuariimicrobium sp. T2.26MG-19.2B]CAI9409436.1 Threonine/homoserine exporter RhtA [Aestuariimicrobium sp. T2.26MG-19.2B]